MKLELNGELMFVFALKAALQTLVAERTVPNPHDSDCLAFDLLNIDQLSDRAHDVQECSLALDIHVWRKNPEPDPMRVVQLHFGPPCAAEDVALNLWLGDENNNTALSQFMQFSNDDSYALHHLPGSDASLGEVAQKLAGLIASYLFDGVVPQEIGLRDRLQDKNSEV